MSVPPLADNPEVSFRARRSPPKQQRHLGRAVDLRVVDADREATFRRLAMRQSDLFIKSPRPWNAGRMIGPKAPLKPKHIWAIRQQLKASHRIRDLAMFNCALDAKLRGCDLVRLRVSDVAPGGMIRQRSTVIQQKTSRPVPFEITEPARDAIAAWLAERGDRDDDWLFPSRNRLGQHIGTRQYARLVDR